VRPATPLMDPAISRLARRASPNEARCDGASATWESPRSTSSPGSSWENGYPESFNGKLRDKLLNVELLDTVLDTKVLAQRCRKHYNTARPNSAPRYRPPVPDPILPRPRNKESFITYVPGPTQPTVSLTGGRPMSSPRM